jgi:sulfur carrier protein
MGFSVVLNGQVREFGAATLSELVAELGLKSDRVAVERNGEIVARGDWSGVQLAAGDKLEVVHFVGGGSQPRSH